MLEGYKRITLYSGSSFISITNNGITFNKNAIQRLKMPERVVFLLNSVEKKIAVQVCSDASDRDAIPFCQKGKDYKNGLRINNRELQQQLASMMNWNLKDKNYRIDGIYLDAESAMIFDMNSAREFNKRNKRKASE